MSYPRITDSAYSRIAKVAGPLDFFKEKFKGDEYYEDAAGDPEVSEFPADRAEIPPTESEDLQNWTDFIMERESDMISRLQEIENWMEFQTERENDYTAKFQEIASQIADLQAQTEMAFASQSSQTQEQIDLLTNQWAGVTEQLEGMATEMSPEPLSTSDQSAQEAKTWWDEYMQANPMPSDRRF